MEEGEWSVDEWSDGRIVLQSSDFTHDATLQISGDFKNKDERQLYAYEIARRLNQFYVKPVTP